MNQSQPSSQSPSRLSPAHLQDGSLVVSNYCHEQILAGSTNGTIIMAVHNKFGRQYAPSAMDLWRLRKQIKQVGKAGNAENNTNNATNLHITELAPKLKSLKLTAPNTPPVPRLDKPIIQSRPPLGNITNQILAIKDKLPEHVAILINRSQVTSCRIKGVTVLSKLSCIARQVGSLYLPYHLKMKYEGHSEPNKYVIAPKFLSYEGCEMFLSREDNEKVRRALSKARGND